MKRNNYDCNCLRCLAHRPLKTWQFILIFSIGAAIGFGSVMMIVAILKD